MALGFVTHLNTDYASAIEQVTAALKAEGFGVLTEIDVKATFKQKLDVDFRPYKVLGACNPNFAHKALNVSSDVGMLIPCNVTVSEVEAGKIEVSIIDPEMMFKVMDSPELESLACEVGDMLKRVIASLEASA